MQSSFCAAHPSTVASQTCRRCGDFACDDCVVVQTSGDPWCTSCHEKYGRYATRIHWERRHEIGLWTAFSRTCLGGLARPHTYFDGVDPEGSYSDPLLLLMITSVIASAGSIAHQAAASSAGQESLADLMDLGDPNPVLLAGVGLVLLAVFPLVTQFIYAGFMWAACLLVGAKGGYRGTYRAVVYAMPGITIIQSAINLVAAGLMLLGPTVAGVVTTCSGLLSSISGLYLLAITMFALRSAHRLSTGRAIAVMAILLGLLFAISCVVGILAVGVVALLV